MQAHDTGGIVLSLQLQEGIRSSQSSRDVPLSLGWGGLQRFILVCLLASLWECQFSLCISSYKLIKFLGVKDDCSVFWLTTGMEQLWHKPSGGIILGVTYLLENLKNTVSA